MASVEPALNRTGETLMIFPLDLSRPRLRMKTKPDAAVALPLVAQIFGNSIGKAEGNEINGAVLLPV